MEIAKEANKEIAIHSSQSKLNNKEIEHP